MARKDPFRNSYKREDWELIWNPHSWSIYFNRIFSYKQLQTRLWTKMFRCSVPPLNGRRQLNTMLINFLNFWNRGQLIKLCMQGPLCEKKFDPKKTISPQRRQQLLVDSKALSDFAIVFCTAMKRLIRIGINLTTDQGAGKSLKVRWHAMLIYVMEL